MSIVTGPPAGFNCLNNKNVSLVSDAQPMVEALRELLFQDSVDFQDQEAPPMLTEIAIDDIDNILDEIERN